MWLAEFNYIKRFYGCLMHFGGFQPQSKLKKIRNCECQRNKKKAHQNEILILQKKFQNKMKIFGDKEIEKEHIIFVSPSQY